MRKSFLSSAIILIIAGFIARLFGFVYRIYLSNLIGAEGMGLYQLVVPVYTAVILTLEAGISISVSKMVAEQQARRNSANSDRITICAFFLVAAAGMLVSVLILLNLDILSRVLLGDERTRLSLIIMVPCIPLVASAAALKGYFYGIQNVMPTAFSQVAEQIVKIGFVMLLTGRLSSNGVEFSCAVATLSSALGEIANMLILAAVCVYRIKMKRRTLRFSAMMRKRVIIARLARQSIPISANRLVVSALAAAENVMIPAMLASGGMEYKSSMELFGRLSGMALPLILFPSLVTNSLATTLVPAISESMSLKNFKSVNNKISKSIQITFILGMIFTAMFFSYPDEIGSLIYRHERIGDLLKLLSCTCVFIYLQQTLMGVLNGLGRQALLLRNTVIGSMMRIATVYFMVPVFGIKSYIIGMAASFLVTSLLNLIAIKRMTGLRLDFKSWLLKPALVGGIILLSAKYVYCFFEIFSLGRIVTTLLALSADMFLAGFFMLMLGILDINEVVEMAGIKKVRNFKR